MLFVFTLSDIKADIVKLKIKLYQEVWKLNVYYKISTINMPL